ncbi:MAG: exodeoxyribonuclease VII large subunit [Roseburia sp.]|uniref:exodeoxyribonuclease VII large subunit n=1 Tax=Roseburia sp. 831b TaxID=1261635 RepID=UPI0009510A2D|nr:exodeoxyribonuclease VII large subunit [Roseburia sp. 831b]MCI5917981.1 exodeoxyribonuclease VII large subunit [Roseburia sp.]MDD6217398.1 exodeoxyribonuclease VII large subunit [Roseburia sp.]WVK74233.1 exodeoxyribonuclease VII large subunit [Roseburia sp. 831b]
MMKNVYSVGQVNTYIKNMFAQDFMMNRISIKGEISNCKYHTSGILYFTLKDASSTISALMFASDCKNLSFRMKEGDKVVATGSIRVYERDGKYQLYAREIELDGAGNLYLKYEALKQELEEMGMFAQEYKRPIPKYVKRVGVVTAPTGAAVQDIRNIAARRNPYVQLILYPALVQGDGAIQSIINGIHALDELGVDVMIVGRGGGSIEDLWAFNEEAVARAIFECETPIISAVGHETDTTIADFVADLRAPTPSAAAELAIYDYQAVEAQRKQYYNRMYRDMEQKLTWYYNRLEQLRVRLRYVSPEHKLRDEQRYVAELEEKLLTQMNRMIEQKKHEFAILAGRLDGLSPAKKLSQGYAYVSDMDGKAIKDAKNVKVDDTVKIHLLEGSLDAKVIKVTE